MQVLQTTKITTNGRIYLGQDVLEALDTEIGDYLQIFKDDARRIRLAKITPPSLTMTEAGHV